MEVRGGVGVVGAGGHSISGALKQPCMPSWTPLDAHGMNAGVQGVDA